jgi:thiamine biosynthesis/tRNA modification protein thiI
MDTVYYLGKIGELSLKKGNKKFFENRLSENLRILLDGKKAKIRVCAGRLTLEAGVQDREACEWALSHLLGITAWAEMSVCEKNLQAIIEKAQEKAREGALSGAKTFKIEVRRGDKTFPLNSFELAQRVGEEIHDSILQTDVHKPDIVINIEVREKVFVYGIQHTGVCGLPAGVSGHGLLLLSGGIDSPVAGFKMLSRGMKVDCVYFHSYPYTSEEAQTKVEQLAQKLAAFGLGAYLNIVPFTKVQQQIKATTDEQYLTLMMRMCMMKIASIVGKHIGADCLITGESLGQVASQTIENLNVTERATDMLVLRPLIGMDKREITDCAIKIGTYDTSILPYADCCVLFSPKHPSLHTDDSKATALYQAMKIEPLLQEAFDTREVKKFVALM